jgi:hypothetical protein
MRLGLYIIASILLMAIVGVFTYSINPENYSYTVLGFPLEMPIAVWMVVPMFLLMVASVVHMMFYGATNFFKFKKWENDTNTLNDALYWALLNEPKAHKFNIKQMKETASLLSVAHITVVGEIKNTSEKLSSALSLVSEISKGEYVDLRAKKLSMLLSKENPLVRKNQLNRLEKDAEFSEIVLQNRENYDAFFYKNALNKFAQETTFPKAKKYIEHFDRESFLILMGRVTSENDLGLDKELLDLFTDKLKNELTCSDYLLISNITMKNFNPTDNLIVWREYEGKYSNAQIAYLYLLFEYELIDKAGEYLDEHDEEDFKRFRALYDLKKEHKKYKITDLMNIRHICDA